jgi:adenosylmethionine-8-amino-7-oxononanoate aminotransferase
LPVAVQAEGAYIATSDGRRIVDAISSWWVITHGHRHPRIVAAIEAQARIMDQVIFAEFTHEPAETLARRSRRRVSTTCSFPTPAPRASRWP